MAPKFIIEKESDGVWEVRQGSYHLKFLKTRARAVRYVRMAKDWMGRLEDLNKEWERLNGPG